MCGIVGAVSNKNITAKVLEGLKKLEYRGYDSAGIAALINGNFNTVKEEGKIAKLEKALQENPLKSNIAITTPDGQLMAFQVKKILILTLLVKFAWCIMVLLKIIKS